MSDKIIMDLKKTITTARITSQVGILAFLLLFAFTGISFALEKKGNGKNKSYEIAITKGAYKVETRDYKDAINYLKTALALKPSDKNAALLLGISQSRAGQYQKARTTLLYALRLDSDDGRTMYELGVVFFNLGEIKEAKKYFEKTKDSNANDRIKTVAGEYLYRISSGQVLDEKPFSLNFLTALQYDSNVILEPTDPLVDAGNKKDWRAVFILDSRWTFLNTRKVIAEAGYMFYQSAHNNLDNFNVQQHNIMLSGKYNPTKNLQAELKYQLNYSAIGGDLYSSTNSIKQVVRLAHSPYLISELYYTYEFKKYFNSDTFFSNSLKTGTSNSAGITERVKLGDSSSISIGYRYDKDSADADFWKYKGHKANFGFASYLWKWKLLLDASYQDRKYQSEFPGFSQKRHDGMQEYSAILTWNPSRRVSISISEIYIINSSNLVIFDYNRSIAGLFLGVRL